MRNIFLTLLSLLVLSSSALAQSRRGNMQVQLADDRPLTVVINGRNYEARGKVITIADLPRGRHSIRVYALRGRNNRTNELVYRGRVPIEIGSTTYVNVDPFEHSARIQVREGRVGGSANSGWNGENRDRNRYRGDDNRDDRRDDRDDNNHSGRGRFSESDLSELRQRVEERATDTDKLSLIKSSLSNRTYTTEQVRSLASLLAFESSKLELAKSAYSRVSDPREYWKLEDIFSFDASKQELNEYINRSK